jgi:DNA (cytosine-5)-methyltransferase 1
MHIVEDPEFLLLDLFCGAGGTSTGFANAEFEGRKIVKIIACVNHDHLAIKSHWINHKDVKHFEEDIRTLNLTALIALVQYYRALYPRAKLILWASLECTNFSKAKGGQARDADSRTLANHLFRYIAAIDPDYIKIENVVEFLAWGPMRIKAKKTYETVKYPFTELVLIKEKKTKEWVYGWEPISKRSGEDYQTWRETICTMGYYDEWKELNSANYGAYTSRNRLFGCFAKPGLPIVWPETTHVKAPKQGSKFKDLKGRELWKPVKDVLDLEDVGESIFNRRRKIKNAKHAVELLTAAKKCTAVYVMPVFLGDALFDPLVITARNMHNINKLITDYYNKHGELTMYYYDDLKEKSLERVYAGLVKYVAGGKDAFMLKYNSTDKNGKHYPPSFDEPCPTIAVQNRLGACFISKTFSGRPEGKVIPVTGPAGAITCRGAGNLVQTQSFLTKYYTTGDNVSSLDEPAGTIPCKDTFQKVWLDMTYSGEANHRSVNGPAGAIVNNDKHRLVNTEWIDRQFSGGGQHSSIDAPAGSVMPVPKMNLVKAEPFITSTNYRGVITSLHEPVSTIPASRRHHYIINPSHGGNSHSTNVPGPVIVARQDKAPLSLMAVSFSDVFIPIYDDDCITMVKIKQFMAMYGISDILMRMLKVSELLKIQGFPAGYILVGNQTDQKKFIGNSVAPIVPQRWLERMYLEVRKLSIAA